ncbi:Ppx/GppA phosphatase family protein [Terrihabitans sp. B22-R8]|uniref:Ppx/GppA phosphatase family protein n=1 Tax=Terrihabitans sp. B22-R8 TaxID=3425128 RepID=UPI00403D37E1
MTFRAPPPVAAASSVGKQPAQVDAPQRAYAAKAPVAPRPSPLYAALDLGTNNCRLLIARPVWDGFRVVDAFSRIVRLGEGMGVSGRLSSEAISRSIEALKVCGDKIVSRGVQRTRLIATEACRSAINGAEFGERVLRETGLRLEIIDRGTEARLAALGCVPLADPQAEGVLVFDIGGGSSELVWIERQKGGFAGEPRIRSWVSLPVGVVTLAERHGGGNHVTPEVFEAMVRDVDPLLDSFPDVEALRKACGRLHMLGTSGTVTTLAGVHMNLPRYDRRRVDGAWLTSPQIDQVMARLRAMSYEERVSNPCIGRERADLVLAGCAILEAVRRRFPCARLRVADRGLREGILIELMRADGLWRPNGRGA